MEKSFRHENLGLGEKRIQSKSLDNPWLFHLIFQKDLFILQGEGSLCLKPDMGFELFSIKDLSDFLLLNAPSFKTLIKENETCLSLWKWEILCRFSPVTKGFSSFNYIYIFYSFSLYEQKNLQPPTSSLLTILTLINLKIWVIFGNAYLASIFFTNCLTIA